MGSEETTALALSHQIIFHPHPPNNDNTTTTTTTRGFIDHQRRYSEFRQSIFNSALHNSDSEDEDDHRGLNNNTNSSSEKKKKKDLNDVKPKNHQPEQIQYPNAIALVDPDGEFYYSHYLHKDCGFSGRKDESGDSLRSILSDPLTGALMDDAMIVPCGHSFGGAGIQHVIKTEACYTCSHHVTEGSAAPNLSLRSAVLAFRKEEESQVQHASKRRKERLDQDRINYNDLMDTPRGKGLQFPFSVADRVIIKGNKRTPERFFGCEAVVTTQCLNGWYVVKTLDTAESIKLQYRSLAKVSDSSSHPSSSKMAPKWL
ncbi:U-box domain-containing protein 62-like [Bidens hawaiensis]|uniref:U-box domain-containing protein 62-like n=1 Tax=Bidens hawaiensis TaxID=980011 RepID=UPI00404A910A